MRKAIEHVIETTSRASRWVQKASTKFTERRLRDWAMRRGKGEFGAELIDAPSKFNLVHWQRHRS